MQPLFNSAIAEQYRLAQRMSGVHREQYGAAARRLAADVQLAWLDHARATRLVELYDRTLPRGMAEDRVTAARRTFELVSRRYEQGTAAQVEFLDARVAYTRAELNQILTACDRAARWVDLEFASALRQPHTSIR